MGLAGNCDHELAAEVRRRKDEEGGGRRREEEGGGRRRSKADIKSNSPHLTGGEKEKKENKHKQHLKNTNIECQRNCQKISQIKYDRMSAYTSDSISVRLIDRMPDE